MSFLEPTTIASASLAIQLFVLVLLVFGYSLKRKSKFNRHGAVMAGAVILHAISIVLVMIPSFAVVVSPDFVLPESQQYIYITGIVHAIAGASAFLLGLGLVAAWRFKKDIRGCFRRKKFMLATFALWVVAIVLGIVLFAVFYGPLLFG